VNIADVTTPSTRYRRREVDAVNVNQSIDVDLIDSIFLDNARALTPNSIRIDFNQPVNINDALLDADSYEIDTITPGAAEVIIQSVELPVGFLNPMFVELHTTEMTDGAAYSAKLVGAITAPDESTSIGNVKGFAGLGETPLLLSVTAKDKNTVEVVFSEPMLDNAAIRNTNNYTFDGGLVVTSVESLVGSVVALKTSDQTSGILYTLSVRGILLAKIDDLVSPQDLATPSGVFSVGIDNSRPVGDSVSVEITT
jgi:hypothetical protein